MTVVVQMHYTVVMKTATIPAIRVEPALRADIQALLGEHETVSEFVEASVRAAVQRRHRQADFIARGLASLDEARRSDDFVDADDVVDGLQRRLDAARASRRGIARA